MRPCAYDANWAETDESGMEIKDAVMQMQVEESGGT